jgi:DivIVA domain-containing protein
MDVTPQELRSSEIKDSWRGYDRDEVDDLLERAAVTIESLTQQVQEVHSRPAPAATAASAPAPTAPLPASRDDADMLQRTLLLAQRAADEAVNEAQTRAKQMLDESEAKAQALVSDAEATARRIAEGERRRLEAELVDLSARRDKLRADADALESYAAGYRDRIRAAIESDLSKLDGEIDAPSERPELHDVDVPTPSDTAPVPVTTVAPEPSIDVREPSGPSGSSGPGAGGTSSDTGPATRSLDSLERNGSAGSPFAAEASTSRAPVAAPPRPEASPSAWPPPATAGESVPGASAETAWLSATDSEWLAESEGFDTPAPWERETGSTPNPFAGELPMEATPIDTDSLDDDAFFASLREAVRDDAPLGPRDDESAPYDAEADAERRRFRRRR